MSIPRAEQHRLAMHLYGQALAIVDPIRIRIWAEAELTTGQVRLLMLLRLQPLATLSWLASELKVSSPTASGLVDRLVRQGHVRREEDPSDRRLVRHRLTASGETILGDLEREGVALLDAILDRMPDASLQMLVDGLTALNAAAAEVAQKTQEARA